MTSNLESLNLTTKDFDLLVQALDFLPEKNVAGEMMVELISTMMAKNDTEAALIKDKAMKQRAKAQGDKELLREETKILQGKLLMLKRYLMENKLLADANEIISKNGKQ